MIRILPAFVALCMFGCSSQKSGSSASPDSTGVVKSATADGKNDTRTSSNPSKTVVLNNPSKEAGTNKPDVSGSLSTCVKELIERFKKEDVQNPPRKIYSYLYKGKNVYYITPPCCDFFSDLYDDNCKIMGHPDGGITGRGDGRFPDFMEARSNEKLVWEDTRKYR